MWRSIASIFTLLNGAQFNLMRLYSSSLDENNSTCNPDLTRNMPLAIYTEALFAYRRRDEGNTIHARVPPRLNTAPLRMNHIASKNNFYSGLKETREIGMGIRSSMSCAKCTPEFRKRQCKIIKHTCCTTMHSTMVPTGKPRNAKHVSWPVRVLLIGCKPKAVLDAHLTSYMYAEKKSTGGILQVTVRNLGRTFGIDINIAFAPTRVALIIRQ
jgi:hypothetical protein